MKTFEIPVSDCGCFVVGFIDETTVASMEKNTEITRLRGAITKLAAECHRAKWQFDLSEDYTPSKSAARALIARSFDELHRIGDLAMKLRAQTSSTGRGHETEQLGSPKRRRHR